MIERQLGIKRQLGHQPDRDDREHFADEHDAEHRIVELPTLPNTGLDLTAAVILALVMIAAGVVIRRRLRQA